MKKVLVGMSGGVDSTVVAVLLKKRGYDVEGVYMKLHDKPGYHEENWRKVRKVGEYLGIKTHFHDLSARFKQEVYDYFVESYRNGLTPNPCVMCNRTIKFGEMIAFADELGIEKVATGHYLKCDGAYIYAAKDRTKDQSYFLCEVKKEVLPRLIFPLGDMDKSDVKAYAADIDVLKEFAEQPESSEICFVENGYDEVLARHMQIDMPGETVDKEGNVIGHHKGYMHYTVGKRRGFFVRGAHEPHYVLDIDASRNRIVVGKKEELLTDGFNIDTVNLFEPFGDLRECSVKIRYRAQAVPCSVRLDGDKGEVKLHTPVYGIARGQAAAFYDGDRLIGGAIIR
jgi:tRNA-specific 2-thiouridylase